MSDKLPGRKGLLMAGGRGSRLFPMTLPVNKHLLPIYDKPLIYYPLSILMLAGIREIAVITTPRDMSAFQSLLGDGSDWGLSLTYLQQDQPGGVAEALLLAEDFLDQDPSMLVLGDNLLYGARLPEQLQKATLHHEGAQLFAYRVNDPSEFGVVSLDPEGRPVAIEEKPPNPETPWAIIGLYLLDGEAPKRARSLARSPRGELEITDLLQTYLDDDSLRAEIMGRGVTWLDTGTPRSLLQAAHFVEVLQERQGLRVACPEEIAFRMDYIDREQLLGLADRLESTEYGRYLRMLARDEHYSPAHHPPPRFQSRS